MWLQNKNFEVSTLSKKCVENVPCCWRTTGQSLPCRLGAARLGQISSLELETRSRAQALLKNNITASRHRTTKPNFYNYFRLSRFRMANNFQFIQLPGTFPLFFDAAFSMESLTQKYNSLHWKTNTSLKQLSYTCHISAYTRFSNQFQVFFRQDLNCQQIFKLFEIYPIGLTRKHIDKISVDLF